ncbi:hypothetical protein [Algihabitans albus]|uniref:hypothetical protein n=1 Tax=Algihabitans albus TaxID=2164067 RepID=UPI000E5C88A5|nr:hypothetical protein [Algihabitans albus]
MTPAISIWSMLAAARRRAILSLFLALISGVAIFYWGQVGGSSYRASSSVLWGWVPPDYREYVPEYLSNVNRVERFLNEGGFDSADYQGCSTVALNLTFPTLEVTCSALSASEALAHADAAATSAAELFNVHARAVTEIMDEQRELRFQQIRIAETAIAKLEKVSPEVGEIVLYENSEMSWRKSLVNERWNLLNFELRVAQLRKAQPTGQAELRSGGRSIGQISAISVVFGLALGLFAALVLGAFDAFRASRQDNAEAHP